MPFHKDTVFLDRFTIVTFKTEKLEFKLHSLFDIFVEILKTFDWWAMTDSNRRHSRCKRDTLPAELIAHIFY